MSLFSQCRILSEIAIPLLIWPEEGCTVLVAISSMLTLEYCISLLFGICQTDIFSLQFLLLADYGPKTEHNTQIPASMHWFPLRYWIKFRVLLPVFQSLCTYLQYTATVLTPCSTITPLCSSSRDLLTIPQSHLKRVENNKQISCLFYMLMFLRFALKAYFYLLIHSSIYLFFWLLNWTIHNRETVWSSLGV